MSSSKRLPMMDFVRRIHFVGIGGVGMSGIAQVLINLGYSVSGSDLKETELTRRLAASGARIRIGHRAANIRGAEVVVFSTAVPRSNPEVKAARSRGIPVARRVEMLAEIARLKKTITVSGTHGKTTVTAMIAVALERAGADPTVIVGGQVAAFGTARLGLGDYLVAEADESDGSFLKLWPLVAVVTNIDDDHLEHYGGFAALKRSFLEHLRHLPFYGTAVLCDDDPVVRGLKSKVGRPVVTYALTDRPPRGPHMPRGRREEEQARRPRKWKGADWLGRILPAKGRGKRATERYREEVPLPYAVGARPTRMQVFRKGRGVGVLTLRVPGRHNALNALAAVAVGGVLSMDLKKIFAGLSGFRGVGRRMERLGEARGIAFYDDYGHHPTEVRATLQAMRSLVPKRGRLIVVFQPHRYSRTKALHRSFGKSFGGADAVHLMDVYPAGEKPMPGVSSRLILDAAKRNRVRIQPFTRAVDMVRELRPGDVVLTLGAGDVWKIGLDLLRRLQAHTLASI